MKKRKRRMSYVVWNGVKNISFRDKERAINYAKSVSKKRRGVCMTTSIVCKDGSETLVSIASFKNGKRAS